MVRTVAWLKGRDGLILARTAFPLTVRATALLRPPLRLPAFRTRLAPFLQDPARDNVVHALLGGVHAQLFQGRRDGGRVLGQPFLQELLRLQTDPCCRTELSFG